MSDKLLGILLIITSCFCGSVFQVMLKFAVISKTKMRYLLFSMSIFIFVLDFILWTLVLSFVELNIAFPMAALSYVFVTIMSFLFFNESITLNRVIGLMFISSGAFFLGMSL